MPGLDLAAGQDVELDPDKGGTDEGRLSLEDMRSWLAVTWIARRPRRLN
jgi:hypothetical protein